MRIVSKIIQRFQRDGFLGGLWHFTRLFCSFLFTFLSPLYYRVANRIVRLLPVRSSVVLECESDLADNPWFYYQYLLSIGFQKKHKIIWLVRDVSACYSRYAENNVVFINRLDTAPSNQLRLNYYLSTSKWLLFSHPYWFTSWRQKQSVVCTTHSVAQLKQAGTLLRDKHICDYVLSCSPYCTKIKMKSFGNHVQYLELGEPRLDVMLSPTDCIRKIWIGYTNERVILSMETFKQSKYWDDSSSADRYAINVIQSLQELSNLNEHLSSLHCIMIVKIHHLQDLSFLDSVQLSNIRFFTDQDLFLAHVQTNELLAAADLLLTDYSSVFYDYLLVDRPIGFMVGDISTYTRGFIVDDPLAEMPGEKVHNYGELVSFINSGLKGLDNYSEERSKIRKKIFTFTDSKNCERLYRWMKSEV